MTILIKQWLFRIAVGFLALAGALSACSPAASSPSSTPKTAADIIARANTAPLHDAAIRFSLTIPIIRFSGTGMVTTQPHRVAITLDPFTATSGSEQRVYDGGLVYIKFPDSSQWQTVSAEDML